MRGGRVNIPLRVCHARDRASLFLTTAPPKSSCEPNRRVRPASAPRRSRPRLIDEFQLVGFGRSLVRVRVRVGLGDPDVKGLDQVGVCGLGPGGDGLTLLQFDPVLLL